MQFINKTVAVACVVTLPLVTTVVPAHAVEPTPQSTGTATETAGADLNTAPGARGTIAVLPDTQFYSRYGAEGNDQFSLQFPDTPNPFDAQTQWIVDKQDELDISMTQHLGDVVDQADVAAEWPVADRAMSTLEKANVPYAIIPGNHDAMGNSFAPYTETFPADRQATSSSHEASSPSGLSNFHTFEVSGVPMGSVNLPWDASDAEFAWANAQLKAHPHLPTIVTSHQIINITDSGDPESTDFGQKLWDEVINPNPQVFLTYSGHHHGATNRVLHNDQGLPVFQQLIDYQMAYQGGNGLMSLVEFDFTNNQLSQTSFSPWVLQKPQEKLTSFDEAVLTDAGSTYSYDFDFGKRFQAIGAEYKPEGSAESYSQKLRAQIDAEFTPAEAIKHTAPACEADYPEVDGTVAHWRPEAKDGKVQYTDITGNGNDMTQKSTGGSATLVDAAPENSAAPHAVRFDPGAKHLFTYFETGDDAPINNEKFEDGYTFETFINIDENFSEDNHWMGFISRFGMRSQLDNLNTDSDLEEPPAQGAISSLREIQWAFAESNDAVEGHSNWSSDVPAGQWLHVAVVDTGAQSDGTGSVTMFVNGAPVLRNAYGPHGLNGIDGKKWIIGGSTYADMLSSGFFGEIGEARFTDHALDKDQWLTEHAGTCPGDSNSSGSSNGSSAGLSIVAVAAALGATVAALAHVNPKVLPAWARPHVKRFQKFIASQK